MQNWFHIIPKNTGLSAFAWIAFCILPSYFIFRSTTTVEIIIGVILIILFFATYRLSFIKKGWTVYVSVGIEMAISIGMTLLFGYIYFALFLAFFIGNIQNKAGFITLYVVHIITTICAAAFSFYNQNPLFLAQFPFVVISIIGVILLPINLYVRNKTERLQLQLDSANQRISKLLVYEERQRIARDLHDTLGQKLSLIGLKSDLAGKLVHVEPDTAKKELNDIHSTARTALKEVREMVSNMKTISLKEELLRIQQVMEAAEVEFHFQGTSELNDTPLLVENVVSMCLKEAATNIVKHSQASKCHIEIRESSSELIVLVKDNGIGAEENINIFNGHGLRGMKERLEFVNGSLEIIPANGTTLKISVPNIIQQSKEEKEE